jgi:hypothetical protein
VREGRAALGNGRKEFASRGVPWIIEASGFDYCMIEHEHGAFDDLETITDLAGWFQATNVSAIASPGQLPLWTPVLDNLCHARVPVSVRPRNVCIQG